MKHDHRRQQPDDDPNDPRVRVRAAVTIIDARGGDEAMEMQAFMDIFHPGHKLTATLVREARNHDR